MLLEGLHIPLTTPFHADGRLNSHKLAANVARYSKTPAAGLIVLGPSGEATLLSDEETREVLRTAAQAAAPEKVLIAGVSRDSVHGTLALADFAAEQNYDAILVGLPGILTPSQSREALTYFQIVADRSRLPVILLTTDLHRLHVELIESLAGHPNIFGLLNCESDESQSAEIGNLIRRTAAIQRTVTVTHTFAAVTARMIQAAAGRAVTLISAATLTGNAATAIAEPLPIPSLKTRTKAVGFQILEGASLSMLEGLRSGATGIAPSFAACAPQACYEVFAAWKDNDQPLAEEKQARLSAAAHLAEDMLGPGGLKSGCDLNGYFGGWPRLPHLPPTGEERAALENLMNGMRS